MKKSAIAILHIGYWLMYLLLLAIVFSAVTVQTRKSQDIYLIFPVIILYLSPNILSFYASYFYLFPKFLKRRKFILLIGFGGLLCLISALLSSLISTIFYGFDQPIFNDRNEFFGFTISLTLIAAVHAVIALIIRGFVSWFEEMKLKEELAKKNYETEILLIKSQINPHFLFNTINNIDVLIAKDSTKASQYLNKLSDILRYMVYDTKNEKISLTKEIDYIEKYLELQKIRTANPNYVNFTIEGETKNLQISPMIFFPFIENSFKHTENNKRLNSINIHFLIDEYSINFECRNTYQKNFMQNQDYAGLGNELIRKRLMLLYPNQYSLEITDNGEIYNVKLLIQISTN